MKDLSRLERKRDALEADYRIGKITDEEYQMMIDAIEDKKNKSFLKSFKRHVKVIKQLSWKSKSASNMKESYENWTISKAEYNQYLRMNSTYIKKTHHWWTYIVLTLCFVWFLFYRFVYMPNKTYIYVDDFTKIWEPIQKSTSWWFTKFVEWENIRFQYLAEYVITWRVLATAQYWATLVERLLWSWALTDNAIRYRDVWIWWWFLADEDYASRFSRWSYNRFLFPSVESKTDWDYISQKYSWDDIQLHFSHNHLIPKDDHVKRLIRWIKKWEYVQIKWYLVSLLWDKWYELSSSLVRDDSWDWACETILVTDVVRLKEKKE